ncbi:MAG: putative Ig domain-containing protein [Steroidobacteraceae bacterium]
MKSFASVARTHVCNAVLCALAAVSLAACGGDDLLNSAGAGTAGLAGDSGAQASVPAPVIEGTPVVAVDAGTPYSFTPTASDSSGSLITFKIANRPAWAAFDTTTGRLSGTPADTDVGDTPGVEISAWNGSASSAIGPFNLKVRPRPPRPVHPVPKNSPPVISGSPTTTVTAGQAYTFAPTATDADGDTLTFMIANKPSWANFSKDDGNLTGTPPLSSVGTFVHIVIGVSDGQVMTALAPFSIQVMPPPEHAPSISGNPATSAIAGQPYGFIPTATDPDGGTLTFNIVNKPEWASFNSRTGQLSGTPQAANVGSFAGILISVSDGQATMALPAFSIEVAAMPNHPPTISGNPAKSVVAGNAYSFQPAASDADADTLTFSVQNRPVWATFDGSHGRLAGTPTDAQVGKYSNIVITVTDGKASVSMPAFSITVSAAPSTAPTISGQPVASINVGSAYSFRPTAAGGSGATLTFSIQNKPSWANFETASGALTGTPSAGDAGTYANIVISVSDGKDSASLPAFTLTVNQVSNGTATLDWTPPTENTDGSVLTNLAGYRVHYGTSANNLTNVVDLANPGLSVYTVSNLSSGTWYFGITAYTASGVESSLSAVVSATFK